MQTRSGLAVGSRTGSPGPIYHAVMNARRRTLGKRGRKRQASIGLPPPLPGSWGAPVPPPAPGQTLADAGRRRWIRGCAAFGTVMVAVGAMVLLTSEGPVTVEGTNDELCTNENLSKVVPAGLWFLWVPLLGAALTAAVLRKRMTRPDRLSNWLAVIGVATAIVLFPAWLNLASGMNCGL